MIPHERSLVAELKDAPFALVGINSDPKDVLRDAMAKENISWRSFWDGGNTAGPIASAWNVSGWPTIYIVDAEGVIRAKDLRDEAMAAKVKELLAELPPPGAKPGKRGQPR